MKNVGFEIHSTVKDRFRAAIPFAAVPIKTKVRQKTSTQITLTLMKARVRRSF